MTCTVGLCGMLVSIFLTNSPEGVLIFYEMKLKRQCKTDLGGVGGAGPVCLLWGPHPGDQSLCRFEVAFVIHLLAVFDPVAQIDKGPL